MDIFIWDKIQNDMSTKASLEDFDKLQEKSDGQLYFEQDGATPHTPESNRNLIKKLFGNNFIQNAEILPIWLIQ